MPIADWSPDDELPDPSRLRPRIAGMGYRLAAAGPRTRQRLIEREAGFPPPDDVRYAIPLAAVLPQRDTPWPEPIEGAAFQPVGALSAPRRGFPVWRSLALVTSAICGFSLVIFGQTLHLDRALKLAAKTDRPVPAGFAPEEIALDARQLAPAAPQAEPLVLASATGPATLPPQFVRAREAAPTPVAMTAPLTAVQAEPLGAPPSAGTIEPPTVAQRPQTLRVYAAQAPVARHVVIAAAPVPHQGEPRRPVARAAHYSLPAWLTAPRRESEPEPPHDLVMSPQPKTLDEQLATRGAPAQQPQQQTQQQQIAASEPDAPQARPQPQRNLPPIPGPHSPPIIYAEAQYPAPRPHLPPPTPYYPPYGGYGGYYQQPAPYYYAPPQSAW
jgi:hypothetical protein